MAVVLDLALTTYLDLLVKLGCRSEALTVYTHDKSTWYGLQREAMSRVSLRTWLIVGSSISLCKDKSLKTPILN